MNGFINNLNRAHVANVKAHYTMGETSKQSLSTDAVKLLALIRRQEPQFKGLSDMAVIEEILAARVSEYAETSRMLERLAREG